MLNIRQYHIREIQGKNYAVGTVWASHYFKCFMCLSGQLYTVDITLPNSHVRKLGLRACTPCSRIQSQQIEEVRLEQGL